MSEVNLSARRLAAACVGALLTLSAYAACSAPPDYQGGGRVIDNGAAAAPAASAIPDASKPDTSVVDAATKG